MEIKVCHFPTESVLVASNFFVELTPVFPKSLHDLTFSLPQVLRVWTLLSKGFVSFSMQLWSSSMYNKDTNVYVTEVSYRFFN